MQTSYIELFLSLLSARYVKRSEDFDCQLFFSFPFNLYPFTFILSFFPVPLTSSPVRTIMFFFFLFPEF